MPTLFLQEWLYAADHFTPDTQSIRENLAQPLGDMEEGCMELSEQDTEQGILTPWNPPAGVPKVLLCAPFTRETDSPFFSLSELGAYWQWTEERTPLATLLEAAGRHSRVVARIALSCRKERVHDPSRILTAWMGLNRRARARALGLPCFPPCVACGMDTTLCCPIENCRLPLCFFCYRDFSRCTVCQPANRYNARPFTVLPLA